MVNLEAEDLKQLITLLKDIPELATERSRQQILELADLKQLSPMIDLSGAPFVSVSTIVSYLSNYGRLTYDHEALGLLLNTLKGFVGVQQQQFLDTLLTKYDMMTPIAALPAINDWRGRETVADIFEKIIGENTLRPISFLQQGLQVAQSVAYIGVRTSQERWSGTGFLVAQNLLLTNNHVLPSSDLLSGTIFRFNYEENFQGEAQITDEYRPKSNGIFHTNQALDYSLIEIEGEPGKKWGWLQFPLLPKEIRRDSRVNIIQHPQGQPKQISLQNNFVQFVGGNVVQYVTSTLQGSSGSPVLNDAWEVVALHHAGGNISEPTTQRRYFRNEGILIKSILADLPSELVDLLKAAKNT
ncbi:trypsin-like peptidase domain-containing protein [Anabaena sphaerica FACHB-251]|uniref:Trypsin-like peptidase domain-containing protein n=1 Tax=Anabaena sphaerica FACHB-251 TaxID=2692883 RepID=A0A926WE23_9NOST|nr:trypsin-like peptidase domain-containing protein [Anabaena sphaerica]MBD2292839.1 trypsin-like peptidase domain-containing protein [Anabaena sphaerica FACHB-251]